MMEEAKARVENRKYFNMIKNVSQWRVCVVDIVQCDY